MVDATLVLGSASPRRRSLLAGLGVAFDVRSVDIDEDGSAAGESDPVERVVRIARAKYDALRAALPAQTPLMTADTTVYLDAEPLGKPPTDAVLAMRLGAMSGRTISVVTAMCVGTTAAAPVVATERTVVQLRPLTSSAIAAYVASGAGRDKAGGLALQAEAAPFIAAVHGCWTNLLGLPLCRTVELVRSETAAEIGDPDCPHLDGTVPTPALVDLARPERS